MVYRISPAGRRFILSGFFFFVSLALIPVLQAQRLFFTGIRLESVSWDYDNFLIEQFSDSVCITQNGKHITSFKRNGGQIISPLYREYDNQGRLRKTDSISSDPTKWRRTTHLYTYYAGTIYSLFHYPDGQPEEIRYYTMNEGYDSLYKSWYLNGTLYQKILFHQGFDTATYTYDANGVLYGKETNDGTWEYYPSGIIKFESTNQLYKGGRLTCQKEFYPTGILESTKYFCADNTPCLIWSYYTAEGILKKTIKHQPFIAIPILGSIEELYKVPDFTYVEQRPQILDPNHSLRNYLDEKLYSIPTQNLHGTYEVTFLVGTDGLSEYRSIKGQNASGIEKYIKFIINNIPKSNPAKVGGRAVNSKLTLQLQKADR